MRKGCIKLVAMAWLAWSVAAQAAQIDGTVSEKLTGRLLARARVILMPVGSGGSQVNAFADAQGRFSIQVPKGAYALGAERRGYAQVWYGQKRWNSPGTPIVLDQDSRFNADIRLSRLGVIRGEVVDENGVGLPEFRVYVYRDTRPLQSAGQGVTDDRGVFRVAGLEPGRYKARTASTQLPDGSGMLPTFFGNSVSSDGSQPIEVRLDDEAEGVVITPVPGRALHLGGQVTFQGAAMVRLYSDLGTEVASPDASGHFLFEGLSPGSYDLIAESELAGQPLVGYLKLALKADMDDARLDGAAPPVVQFRCEDGEGKLLEGGSSSMLVKRSWPPDEPRAERLNCGDSTAATVGMSQFTILTPGTYYVSKVLVQGKVSESNEISLMPGEKVAITLVAAYKPATLTGTVMGQDEQPAVGAMVFLRAVDASLERRMYGKASTKTGQDGSFAIKGLPPGRYLVATSFEVQTADDIDWKDPSLKTVELEEGKETTVKLGR